MNDPNFGWKFLALVLGLMLAGMLLLSFTNGPSEDPDCEAPSLSSPC